MNYMDFLRLIGFQANKENEFDGNRNNKYGMPWHTIYRITVYSSKTLIYTILIISIYDIIRVDVCLYEYMYVCMCV